MSVWGHHPPWRWGLRGHGPVLLRGGGLALGDMRAPWSGGSLALPDSASCSDTVEEDEDLYDCVENEEAEGDEIYEDLMRSEPVPMPVCRGRRTGPGPVPGRGAALDPQHLPFLPILSPR